MAFSEALATRVREILTARTGFAERRMFGGLAFLVNGHMCCGVVGDRLMVRVGRSRYEAALRRPHVTEMDFSGRPLTGLVYVRPPALRTRRALAAWVGRGLAFVATLPPKRVAGRGIPVAGPRRGGQPARSLT